MRRLLKLVLLALTAVLFAGLPTLGGSAGPPDPILVGAGDIAVCGSNNNDELTAQLLDAIFTGDPPGAVFTAGDNAYETGTTAEFNTCYDPTWGRHKTRTRPSPGNHEYYSGGGGYYGYFGTAAGNPSEGYYSYELGAWHVVVINASNGCSPIPCAAGSAQEQWLRADLAASTADCTVAYWHHPRFSSGQHGNHPFMGAIWQALFDHGVDVVISGHDHTYERFAPQDPNANSEPVRGIREFIAGTGGRSHYSFPVIAANSVVRDNTSYGVLKLTLHASSYDWEFIPAPTTGTFTDSGSGQCLTPDIDDDTDGDGCTDLDEMRTAAGSETSGGRRDESNVWDYFDTPTGSPLERDGSVSGTDFFALISRFSSTGDGGIDPLSVPPSAPAYHTAYDRGGSSGPNPWNLTMANGAIAGTDFFSLLAQFGHACG